VRLDSFVEVISRYKIWEKHYAYENDKKNNSFETHKVISQCTKENCRHGKTNTYILAIIFPRSAISLSLCQPPTKGAIAPGGGL
jgi:hypothetical protein